jgi:hypothetical protein
MITSIFVLAILIGLFFRSLYGFYFSLFALFLLLYPIATISLIIARLAYVYFSNNGDNNHEQSTSNKLNPPSNRDGL